MPQAFMASHRFTPFQLLQIVYFLFEERVHA